MPTKSFTRAATLLVIVLAAGLAAGLPATRVGPTRLIPSTDDRSRIWHDSFERMDLANVPFGTGPGTYALVSRHDGETTLTLFAHNEYLQALLETGVVGLLSIVAAIWLCTLALIRTRPKGEGPSSMWAASVGGGAGFLLHSGFDFLWHIPLLVAIAFVLLAVGIGPKSQWGR
jgi:O-antigen ligase